METIAEALTSVKYSNDWENRNTINTGSVNMLANSQDKRWNLTLIEEYMKAGRNAICNFLVCLLNYVW